ncbi:hypothetical protein CK203_081175 [Vitis vinifera]|uniref:Uncharacterized protein n=1 Tax=Vitis vinifera TaxID=29760 RepID=A0A438ERC5_VITVI|nr:hypothetical protein CK203_081175 [Vitis vinifera]
MFQAMGFLAPLAPRALQILCPHSFVLIYIVHTTSQQDITLIVALLYDMPYRTLLILGRLGILSRYVSYSYLSSGHACRRLFTSSL